MFPYLRFQNWCPSKLCVSLTYLLMKANVHWPLQGKQRKPIVKWMPWVTLNNGIDSEMLKYIFLLSPLIHKNGFNRQYKYSMEVGGISAFPFANMKAISHSVRWSPPFTNIMCGWSMHCTPRHPEHCTLMLAIRRQHCLYPVSSVKHTYWRWGVAQ